MLTFFSFKEDTYVAIARQVLGCKNTVKDLIALLFPSTKCVSTKSTELNRPVAKTSETVDLFLYSKIGVFLCI